VEQVPGQSSTDHWLAIDVATAPVVRAHELRHAWEHAASVAALMLTTEALVAEELIAQPGAVIAPGFGDLAEGLARPSSPT
jgi:hypothetical protein